MTLLQVADQPEGPFSSLWLCSAYDAFGLLLVFNLYLIALFLVYLHPPSQCRSASQNIKIPMNLCCSRIEVEGEMK